MIEPKDYLELIVCEFLDRLDKEPFKSLLDQKETVSLLNETKRLLAKKNGNDEPLIHLALDKVLGVINRALYISINNGRLGLTELTQIINIIGTSKPIVSEEKDN